MKITKTKLAAASFGAALTSMYSAPELNAQVVDLSFTPSTVPYGSGFQAAGTTSNGVSLVSLVFLNNSFARTFYGTLSLSDIASVDPGDVFSSGFVSNGTNPFFSSGLFFTFNFNWH